MVKEDIMSVSYKYCLHLLQKLWIYTVTVTHLYSHTHKHKIHLMDDSNKHWGFCLSFAFSISTICILSLKLPQPIQTAAILNRATHIRLPTEGHYCVSWPRLSQTNNQAVTEERKQLHLSDCLCKKYQNKICNFIVKGGIIVSVLPLTKPALRSHFKHSSVFSQWMGKANPNNPVGKKKRFVTASPDLQQISDVSQHSIYHPDALLHPFIYVPVGLQSSL